jgi:TonB family protein
MVVTTLPGKTLNVLLTERQGSSVRQYLGKLDGALTVDASGRVAGMDGRILSLETEDGKSIPVAKSEVQDGTILLTTEAGARYQIYNMSSTLSGSIRLLKAGNPTPRKPGPAPGGAPAAAKATRPAVSATGAQKYRVVTAEDGVSCKFSQDISMSLGSGFSGTMSASANHFRCTGMAHEEVEIELISAGVDNGKVAIRTRRFGTVYRGNEEGTLDVYEMTDSQIERLKSYLASRPAPKPPSPSAAARQEAAPAAPRRIRVDGAVQAAKLVRQPKPVYPPLAKQGRISGVVRLSAVLAKDGSVLSLSLVQGHPLLVPAAMEAARQWTYTPTLLNGEPMEVQTTIDVSFTLDQ